MGGLPTCFHSHCVLMKKSQIATKIPKRDHAQETQHTAALGQILERMDIMGQTHVQVQEQDILRDFCDLTT